MKGSLRLKRLECCFTMAMQDESQTASNTNPATSATPSDVVFTLQQVTKSYHMGEVDVQALYAVSLPDTF